MNNQQTTLVASNRNPDSTELATLERMAELLYQSGFCKGARTSSQAVALILMGREVGLPAMQALSTIHVIEGKPTASVHLMGALLARGGVSWQATKHDDSGCTIEFERPGWKPAISTFARQDAERAGLVNKDNWRKWPRNMMYARAFTEGARMIAPDLLCGLNYTPEELAPDVAIDERGEPTEMPQQAKSIAQKPESGRSRLMKYCIMRMNQLAWSNQAQRDYCTKVCDRPIASRADILEVEWQRIAQALDGKEDSKLDQTSSGYPSSWNEVQLESSPPLREPGEEG